LHQRLIYEPGTTAVGTIAGAALDAGRGVCQDYTHIMLATMRVLGIPSRYTSGYFSGSGADGEVGEQASHAWVEVWFPSHGWAGIDPTNDRVVDDSYIRVAYGRDYGDVSPVRGSYRGAETSGMDVGVWVSSGWQQQQEQQQQ
jgi:transglutaminase-like putative cysteine protease